MHRWVSQGRVDCNFGRIDLSVQSLTVSGRPMRRDPTKRRVLVDATPESQARVNSDQSVLLKGDVNAFLLGSQTQTSPIVAAYKSGSHSTSGTTGTTSSSHVSDSQQQQPFSHVSNNSLDFRLDSNTDLGSSDRFGGGATQAVQAVYGSRSDNAEDPVVGGHIFEEHESQKENSQPVAVGAASPSRPSRPPSSLSTSPELSRQLVGDIPRASHKGKLRLSTIDDISSSPLRASTQTSASQLQFSVGRLVEEDLPINRPNQQQGGASTCVAVASMVEASSPIKKGFKYRSFNDIKVLPWASKKRKKNEWGSDEEGEDEASSSSTSEEDGRRRRRRRRNLKGRSSSPVHEVVAPPSSSPPTSPPLPAQRQSLLAPTSSMVDELETTQRSTERESDAKDGQSRVVQQQPLFLSSTTEGRDDHPGT
jgi:hypothetical protein